MTNPSNDLCYPVLTPFKFRGVVVKPPAFIQLGADEASEYQEAGVLGGHDVAVLTPEPESNGHNETPPKVPRAPATPKATTKSTGNKAGK